MEKLVVMPEGTNSSSRQEETLDAVRRQEGDGNDFCTSGNQSSSSGPSVSSPVLTPKPSGGSLKNDDHSDYSDAKFQGQNSCKEGPTACVTDQGISLSCESEVRNTASSLAAGNISKLSLAQSNAPRLTSKELRQQSRQLQSQELIRRILQSTSEVQSLVLEQKAVSPKHQSDNLKRNSDASTPRFETAQKSTVDGARLTPDQASKSQSSAPFVVNETNAVHSGSSSVTELPQTTSVCTDSQHYPQQNCPLDEESKAQPSLTNITVCQAQEISSAMQSLTNPETSVVYEGKGDSSLRSQRLDSFIGASSLSSGSLDDCDKDLSNPSGFQQPMRMDETLAKSVKAKSIKGFPADVHQLSEKLEISPTQETLQEILYILKHQSQLPSAGNGVQGPVQAGSAHQPHSSTASQQPSVSQPFSARVTDAHARNHTSFQENDTHQTMEDLKTYYESELEKLHIQLDGLRGNLSSLEGVLPMKMLDVTNQKLEQRCQLLEEIADELKNKCEKLEMTNQDLDIACCQLQKTNQTLEIRYQYLEQTNQVLAAKQLKLQDTIQGLESRIVEFIEVSKGAELKCRQLEEANLNSAAEFRQLEAARDKMELRNKKLSDEVQHVTAGSVKLQEMLLETNRHCQDLEEKLAFFQAEKNDWLAKMDATNKTSINTQHQLEELRSQSSAKDEFIHKLEEEIKGVTLSFDKVNQGKVECDENAKRDKQLLQNLLIEYDALVKEHHLSQMREKSLADKLYSTEGEVNELRGTVSKLIHRNSGLEDSLKETLLKLSHDSSPSPGRNALSSAVHRSQELPTTPTKEESHVHVLASTSGQTDNHKERDKSPARSELNGVADAPASQKANTSSLRFNPSRKSTSTPVKSPKRNLETSYKAGSPSPKASRSPSNLVVKKADLVTRFDVVFEDVKSGELLSRTHSGRTVRSCHPLDTTQGVPSRTDRRGASPERLVGGDAQGALNAIRNGKVMTAGDWEGPRNSDVRKEKRGSTLEKSTSISEISNVDESMYGTRRTVVELERKFSTLMDERKRLESTLSRIPSHRPTKRAKEDKAYLESRLDEVTQSIGSVRMQLRLHHAL